MRAAGLFDVPAINSNPLIAASQHSLANLSRNSSTSGRPNAHREDSLKIKSAMHSSRYNHDLNEAVEFVARHRAALGKFHLFELIRGESDDIGDTYIIDKEHAKEALDQVRRMKSKRRTSVTIVDLHEKTPLSIISLHMAGDGSMSALFRGEKPYNLIQATYDKKGNLRQIAEKNSDYPWTRRPIGASASTDAILIKYGSVRAIKDEMETRIMTRMEEWKKAEESLRFNSITHYVTSKGDTVMVRARSNDKLDNPFGPALIEKGQRSKYFSDGIRINNPALGPNAPFDEDGNIVWRKPYEP